MSRRQKNRKAAAPLAQSPSERSPKPKPTAAGGGGRGGLAVFWVRGGVVLLVVFLLGLLGGYLWLKSYLRSEGFREQLGQSIGAAAGGRAEVQAMEWHGANMEVDRLSLVSPKAGDWVLQDVVTAIDLSGLWKRVWMVPDIEVREARSTWDFRQSNESGQSDENSREEGAGVLIGKRKKRAGKSSNWLPNRTEVHALSVRDYEGAIQTELGEYSWDGVALNCQPRPQFSTIVSLAGGRWQTPHPWASALKLETGTLAISGEGVEVIASEWRGDGFQSLSVTGEFGGATRLSALFEEWELALLLPLEWQKVLSGRINGSGHWEPEVVEGDLEVSDCVLQGLPFISRLAAYTGEARLQRLSFEQAKAKIRKRKDSWDVQDLLLFDQGLLRVEGRIAGGAGGGLSGRLEVGVPPGLLARIPGAEEKVFLPGKNGMLWATVTLSGTMSRPKEDLSARMIQAAGERMFELVPETGRWALRHSGEVLDEGTALLLENQGLILEEGREAVEGVVEQGGKAVEEGVKAGFGILNGILGDGE